LNPSSAFDELDKLIFCKLWDERKPGKKGEPYYFQIFMESTEAKKPLAAPAQFLHSFLTIFFLKALQICRPAGL